LQNREKFDEIRKKEEMHRDKLIAELRVKRDTAYHKTMGKFKKKQ
jgi:DNA-binding XRE family transcriptional regulator